MTKIEQRLADLKALQEQGKTNLCPRCGRPTMKEHLYINALSRVADIQICDHCGVDEAKLAWMGQQTSLYGWAMLQPTRPEGDFRAMDADKAMVTILAAQTQLLTELFKRSETDEAPDAIRFDAFEQLQGLRELWAKPFEARYSALDGEVVVQLKRQDEGILIAADIVAGK